MEQDKSSSGYSPGTRAMLWTLLIVYVFNFLDRQIVNILAEPIAKDLNLSDTQLGLMTGFAFAVFYTFLGLPIARYADKPSTHRGRLIAVALAIWSAMTALCGLAQNFFQLLLARIGVGVGEAGCTPAAHSLIADKVSAEKRPGAMAFYAMGIPIGSLLGAVLGGWMADTIGWRNAFLIAGLPGIALAVVVLFVLKDGDRPVRAMPAGQSSESMLQAIAQLAKSPAYLLLVAGASASAFLSYGKSTWTTIFLQRSYGMTPGEVGFTFGLWGGLAGIFGTWLGGWLADRYGKVNRRMIMTAPTIGMLLAIPIALAAYQATDRWTSLALILLPTMLNSLYYGPVYSSAQGLVAVRHRAMASAMLLFGQNLIGLGLGPLFFGMISDALKPQYGPDSVRYVLYGAALLGVIPVLCYYLLGKRLNAELDQQEAKGA